MSKTVTDATLFRAFKKVTEKSISDQITQEIHEKVQESKIHTGKLVRYYPWLNKAKVSVNGEHKTCKVLNRCGGNIVDLFTPMGVDEYDDDLKEPSVIPLAQLPCLVADVNSGDDEWILLGYYQPESMTITTPAEKGDYKIARVDALDEQEFTMRSEGTYTKSEVDELINNLRNEILGVVVDDESSDTG